MENHWAQLDDHLCPCSGSGWAEVSHEVYKECPIHYIGQLHPETRSLLLDDPTRLSDEERRSLLRFRITEAQSRVLQLQKELREAQECIVNLELELINKTPTRKMEVVKTKNVEPELEILHIDYASGE